MQSNVLFRLFFLLTAQVGSISAAIRLIFENCYNHTLFNAKINVLWSIAICNSCTLLRNVKKCFTKMHSLHRHDAVQGFGCSQQVFCNAKMVFVYTKTLLATTMKPLNVLPRFENPFAIKTVRFQVQLEADGYFFSENFRVCIRSKQGELVPTRNF